MQGYDNIARLSSIAFNGTNYLNVNTYNPAGQVLGVSYGNGVAGDFTYNDRLQLASLRYHSASDLLNLAYSYGSSNNGQIRTINAYSSPGVQDAAKSLNYYYDNLGRLTKAETQNLTSANTYRLEWAYDRYGNRLSQSLTGGTISTTAPQLTIDATTNRITTAGYGYDAAGNMTNDTLHTYTYDAENRIKTLDGVAAGYAYDAAGLRVIKGSTVYIYSGTKVIAEYASGAAATSPSKEYVYSGTSLLATVAGGATTYTYPDHLSTRVEANSSGTVTRTFGHLPFGELWYQTGTDSKWKFTSYERDSDTGLDYAIFRSYSSRLGRFMEIDPVGGSGLVPQSLNRFTYVIDDPVNLTDRLGLAFCNFRVQLQAGSGVKLSEIEAGMQNEIRRIFENAGVGVDFNSTQAPDYTLRAMNQVPENLNVSATAAGATAVDPNTGRILDIGSVFESRIGASDFDTLQQTGMMAIALGRAGAHEIGHHLLQTGHSKEGLMQPAFHGDMWHKPDLKGSFTFTQQQANNLFMECMRRRLNELGLGRMTFDPQIIWGSPIPWDQRAMNDFLNSLDSIETGWNDPPPEVVPVD